MERHWVGRPKQKWLEAVDKDNIADDILTTKYVFKQPEWRKKFI